MINFENILIETTQAICTKMGVEVEQVPPVEVLRYFKFQEIPFLLFFIARKHHRVSMKEVGEQYERETGQFFSYDAIRHLVGKYFDEVERVKMMERKSGANLH